MGKINKATFATLAAAIVGVVASFLPEVFTTDVQGAVTTVAVALFAYFSPANTT